MDDLIRREDAMQRFLDEVKQSGKDHIHINTIKKLLDDVDVAYNVDKVCKKLDEMSYVEEKNPLDPFGDIDTKVVTLSTAKRIVKAGGV